MIWITLSPISTLSLISKYRYKGDAPLFQICVHAQMYYKQHDFATKVLVASLTSVDEIMVLAGVDHITIAPKLLHELASTETDPSETTDSKPAFEQLKAARDQTPSGFSYADDDAAFRIAMTRESNGASEGKLIQVCEDKRRKKLPR